MPMPRTRFVPIDQIADPDPFGLIAAAEADAPPARDGMVRHDRAYRFVQVGGRYVPVAHRAICSPCPIGTPPPGLSSVPSH